jgi:hypothetical protein
MPKMLFVVLPSTSFNVPEFQQNNITWLFSSFHTAKQYSQKYIAALFV